MAGNSDILLAEKSLEPRAALRMNSDREAEGPGQPAAAGEIVDVLALTRAIVGGDEPAFGRFYDLYSARLRRFSLILARGEELTAKEIHQTVMIKAARKFKVFATDGELWAWLSQVARNAFVDHVRRESRRPKGDIIEISAAASSGTGPGNDARLVEWLERGLVCLAPEERALLESVYFEGRPQQKLAVESGKSLKSIQSRLARTREKLRALILEIIRNG
jgi:RNA polymerase sigma-70 factor (ECF subfamily)